MGEMIIRYCNKCGRKMEIEMGSGTRSNMFCSAACAFENHRERARIKMEMRRKRERGKGDGQK